MAGNKISAVAATGSGGKKTTQTAIPDYNAVLKQVEEQTAAARETQAQRDAQAAAAQAQLKAEAEARARAAAASSPNYNPNALAAAVAAGRITAEQARNMLGGQTQNTAAATANGLTPAQAQLKAEAEARAKAAQTTQTAVPDYDAVLKQLAAANPQVSANTVANMTVPTAEQIRAATAQAQTSGGLTPAQAQIRAEAEARARAAGAADDVSGGATGTGGGVNQTGTGGGSGQTETDGGKTESSWEDDLTEFLEEKQTEEEPEEPEEDEREEDRTEYQEILDSYDGTAGRDPYYEDRYRALLDRLEAYPEFQYDQNTDPVWSALAKQYRREGNRATADTLGQYAAMTGGIPSTAAVSAAQQAGNYYAGQLADRLPEVYQQAYQRYLDEYSRKLGLAGEYRYGMGAEEDRYQADRNFAYQQSIDQRNFDYNRYLNEIEQENAERELAYRQSQLSAERQAQTVELSTLPTVQRTGSTEGTPGVTFITSGKEWDSLADRYGEDWLAQNGFRRVTAPTAETETKDVPVVSGGTGNNSGLEGRPKKDISATYYDNGEQNYDSIEAEYQAALQNTSKAVAFIKKYGGYTPLSEGEFSGTAMEAQYGNYARYVQSLLAALMA